MTEFTEFQKRRMRAQLEYEEQLALELMAKAEHEKAVGDAYTKIVSEFKEKYFFNRATRVYYHNNPDLFIEITPNGTVLIGCDAGDFKPSITEAKECLLYEIDEVRASFDKIQKKEDRYYAALGKENPVRVKRVKKEETNE